MRPLLGKREAALPPEDDQDKARGRRQKTQKRGGKRADLSGHHSAGYKGAAPEEGGEGELNVDQHVTPSASNESPCGEGDGAVIACLHTGGLSRRLVYLLKSLLSTRKKGGGRP